MFELDGVNCDRVAEQNSFSAVFMLYLRYLVGGVAQWLGVDVGL